MLTRLVKWASLVFSWLGAFLDTSKKLHPGRLAYKHELLPLEAASFTGTHLLIGEGAYGQVYAVKGAVNKRELGNISKLGPTRCGKSSAELCQIVDWAGSGIIFDIKGELYPKVAGYLARRGRVLTLDLSGGTGHQYDPLQGQTSERALYKLAKHLVFDPRDKETIFSERAAKMLTQLFLAALHVGERALPYVARVINLGLNEVADRLNGVSPVLAQKFLDTTYSPGKDFEKSEFRADAWGTLATRLYAFLTPDVVSSFAGSDFRAADLYFSDRPVYVFLRFHETDLLAMGPLIKFICESLINELLVTYDQAPVDKQQTCRDILWSMDEAGRIGIPNLPEHASTVNGRRISLSLSAQSRSQFEAVYGRYRTENLFTNIRTQLVFRQADLATAKHYSERMGDTSGFAHSESEHEGQTTSTGKSERGIPVMSPQDFLEMDDGELVCFLPQHKPFRLKSMDARRHPQLQKRLGLVPPPLSPLPLVAPEAPEAARTPAPLASWHFDPMLFRKWPKKAARGRDGEEEPEAPDAELWN